VRFLPLVLKNILRKRTRTALTVASVVLPLLVICLLATFVRALERPDPALTRGMFRLVTRHQVSLAVPIPAAYADRIARLPGVAAATKFTWFGGTYVDKSAKNFFPRFAVEPETFLGVFDDATVLEGSNEEWLKDRTGCVVGIDSFRKYGWRLGQKITIVGDIYPVNLELTIRGVFDLPEKGTARAIFFNRKYLEEALPATAGQIGTVYVKAADAASAGRLPKEIDALFENSPAPTKTESEKAFQTGFVEQLGNVKLLIGAIGFSIGLVILLISANTMSLAARERVTEIAVLRTLGYTRETVFGLVLAESLALSLTGGLIGLVLFSLLEPGLKRGLANSPAGAFAASFTIFPEVLALGFAIAVGVGVLSGIVPALQSARRSIVDGLRRVA
jgi:putative ABC transport system permease protein